MRFIQSVLFSVFVASNLSAADDLKIVESIQTDITVIKRKDAGDIYLIRSEWREAGPLYPYGSRTNGDGTLNKHPSVELKSWDHSGFYGRPLLTGNLSGEITRVIVMSTDGKSIDHGVYNITQRDGGEKKFGRADDTRPDAVKLMLPMSLSDDRLHHLGFPLLDTESMNGKTLLSTHSIKKTSSVKNGEIKYSTTVLTNSAETSFVGRIRDTDAENLSAISYDTFRELMKDEEGHRVAFLTTAMGLTPHKDQEKTLSFENGITDSGWVKEKDCTGIKCDVFGFPIAPKVEAVAGSNSPANPAMKPAETTAPKEGTATTNPADLLKPVETPK